MKEYLDLVSSVLDRGVRKPSRTGVDTISTFGAFYRVDLSKGFPLLTTKKVNFAAVLHELLFFLSGENHIRNFRKVSKIWDEWATPEGDLESAYGYYWRHFPSPMGEMVEPGAPAGPGLPKVERVEHVDQIQFVIDELKRNPFSRRLVVTAWEPGNAIRSKLPPCHYTFAFNVTPDRPFCQCQGCGSAVHQQNGWSDTAHCAVCQAETRIRVGHRHLLNCHLTQRSGDTALGIPFNLASYAILTQMVAQEVGMGVGEFAHTIIDAHIYAADEGSPTAEYDHRKGLREQLQRKPGALPSLKIATKPFNELKFEDFQLLNYNPAPAIRFKVAV